MNECLWVFKLIESFSRPLEFFIHGQKLSNSGIHSRLFSDEENDIFHLYFSRATDLHGPLGHAGDELHHQVFKKVHSFLVGVLVVTVPEKGQPKFLKGRRMA